MSFITRFAPSPTGDLHIGGVRTALYCWLIAKKNQGKLILRIEDTDLERSTANSVEIILEGLKWLGINWDLGPFFQTQRFARYAEMANKLLSNNLAYRCDCSKERLEQLRTQQMQNKQKPKYDNHCREKKLPSSHNKPFVIRFKNPLHGTVEFNDLIRGIIRTSNEELDDFILVRSNNAPTYNFTVVIDDLDMQITDVIRGEDHISNTPKQINLFLAFGAKIPSYAHIPMILGEDGARLSKRHGASSVLAYKNLGILPAALINYLVRLGWSNKNQEIFSISELIDLFNLKSVQKSPAIFNMNKLLWLNQHYIATSESNDLIQPVMEQLVTLGVKLELINQQKIIQIIELYKSRVKTLQEMAQESMCLFQDQLNIDLNSFPNILNSIIDHPRILLALKQILSDLEKSTIWDAISLHSILKSNVVNFNLKFPELAIPLRVAVIGKEQSPSLDQILELLGKEKTLSRITKFIAQLILTSNIK